MELREILEKRELIEGLSDEEAGQLVEIAELCRYSSGEVIIPEITRSRDLFILGQGCVSISMTIPIENRQSEMIDRLHPGELIGEISFLDGSPRSASAVAENNSLVYRFRYEKLDALMAENPRIGYALMRGIAQIIAAKIRQTNLAWRNMLMW